MNFRGKLRYREKDQWLRRAERIEYILPDEELFYGQGIATDVAGNIPIPYCRLKDFQKLVDLKKQTEKLYAKSFKAYKELIAEASQFVYRNVKHNEIPREHAFNYNGGCVSLGKEGVSHGSFNKTARTLTNSFYINRMKAYQKRHDRYGEMLSIIRRYKLMAAYLAAKSQMPKEDKKLRFSNKLVIVKIGNEAHQFVAHYSDNGRFTYAEFKGEMPVGFIDTGVT